MMHNSQKHSFTCRPERRLYQCAAALAQRHAFDQRTTQQDERRRRGARHMPHTHDTHTMAAHGAPREGSTTRVLACPVPRSGGRQHARLRSRRTAASKRKTTHTHEHETRTQPHARNKNRTRCAELSSTTRGATRETKMKHYEKALPVRRCSSTWMQRRAFYQSRSA